MCFSSGGGGDGGAADAAAAEARRRRNIQAGIANIDKVFSGTDTGINPVNAPAAGGNYFLADGTPVSLAMLDAPNPAYVPPDPNGGSGSGWGQNGYSPGGQPSQPGVPATIQKLGYNGAAGPVYADPSSKFFGATQHQGGFDEPFYKGIEDSYKGYAQPQLDRDYQEALRQLTFSLARRGIGSSSAAGTEQGKLQEQYNKYGTDVASAGKAYAQSTRANVENSRTDLINQLSATEDPIAAGTSALRSYAVNSQMPAFNPVANFAFNVSEGLKQQSAQNGYRPIFSPSIFSSKPNSSISYVGN